MVIEMDLNFYINNSDKIPRFERDSKGKVQKFSHEVLVKFLCVHLAILRRAINQNR